MAESQCFGCGGRVTHFFWVDGRSDDTRGIAFACKTHIVELAELLVKETGRPVAIMWLTRKGEEEIDGW